MSRVRLLALAEVGAERDSARGSQKQLKSSCLLYSMSVARKHHQSNGTICVDIAKINELEMSQLLL